MSLVSRVCIDPSVMGAGETGVITLRGPMDRIYSLKLFGFTVYCLLKLYGIFDSIECDSIVSICDSGEATDDIVIIFLTGAPDNSVELWMSTGSFPGGM